MVVSLRTVLSPSTLSASWTRRVSPRCGRTGFTTPSPSTRISARRVSQLFPGTFASWREVAVRFGTATRGSSAVPPHASLEGVDRRLPRRQPRSSGGRPQQASVAWLRAGPQPRHPSPQHCKPLASIWKCAWLKAERSVTFWECGCRASPASKTQAYRRSVARPIARRTEFRDRILLTVTFFVGLGSGPG